MVPSANDCRTSGEHQRRRQGRITFVRALPWLLKVTRTGTKGSGPLGTYMDIDNAGFEKWYRTEHPRVLAALSVVASDPDLAQEVTAEAFARALQRWDRVGEMDSPGGWTYRVALNVLRRRARRAALERRLLPRLAPPAVITVPSYAIEVWQAVTGLAPRMRTAVALRYLGGLTEAEVADLMGITPGTVAATLHEARRRLAPLLTLDTSPEEVPHG
jgi:DNA-directed RNA polymerase specialized sigma24 family protein